MATSANYAASYIMDIESMFDLDTVLTGADDFYYFHTVVAPPPMMVADLPTVAVADDVCAVCMEDFLPDEGAKQIPCGHVYHQSCLSSWLSIRDSCPLCRCHITPGDKTETSKTVQV